MKTPTEMPPRKELLSREKSSMRQGRVKKGAGMTLAQNETVTLRPFGMFRVNPKMMKVEGRNDLSNR